MRAASVSTTGIRILEIPTPEPKENEVLVRVVASAVNAAEAKVMSGDFVGRFLHARVEPLVLGWDFAGTVEKTGSAVGDLKAGDAVWGHLAYSNSQKQGTYAEFITVSRDELASKPESVSFGTAAAAATVAMTGLQSMRDLGGLGPEKRVLIVGAGGGIGLVSVGIARRLGAHVTAICSTKDVDRVNAFGPDVIIDRKQVDPFAGQAVYDVIFDTPAAYSFAAFAGKLGAGGAYVTTLPGLALISGMMRALLSSKSCHFVQVASRRADLELIGAWLADGLDVPIDSVHTVGSLETALARQSARDRAGRVVVEVDGAWG